MTENDYDVLFKAKVKSAILRPSEWNGEHTAALPSSSDSVLSHASWSPNMDVIETYLK